VKVFVYIHNYDIHTYVKQSEKLPIASGKWGLLEWKAFDSQTLLIICKMFNPYQGTFPVCSCKSKDAKAHMGISGQDYNDVTITSTSHQNTKPKIKQKSRI
jgi:hypothetical protein